MGWQTKIQTIQDLTSSYVIKAMDASGHFPNFLSAECGMNAIDAVASCMG